MTTLPADCVASFTTVAKSANLVERFIGKILPPRSVDMTSPSALDRAFINTDLSRDRLACYSTAHCRIRGSAGFRDPPCFSHSHWTLLQNSPDQIPFVIIVLVLVTFVSRD